MGDARLALAAYWKEIKLDASDHSLAAQRMHQPTPRVALGVALRSIANAAVDISDGLMGDLGHILERSHVGASLYIDSLPAGLILSQQPLAKRREFTLAGGDDYELCFTAPAAQRSNVIVAGLASNTALTRIGCIQQESGVRLLDDFAQAVTLQFTSFDHFSTP